MPTTLPTTLNLFIGGPNPYNSNIDMAIIAHEIFTKPFKLFVKSDDVKNYNDYLNLNVFGSEVGYTNTSEKSLRLYIKSSVENSTTLFVKVESTGYKNSNKTLYIKGSNKQTLDSLNLFLKNTTSQSLDFIKLHIIGSGVNYGWFPNGDGMNLFIEREFEGIASSLTLFVSANNSYSDLTNLHIHGNTTFTSSLDLFNAGGIGLEGQLFTLYTHGY
jgi:hypothetical protein